MRLKRQRLEGARFWEVGVLGMFSICRRRRRQQQQQQQQYLGWHYMH